MIRDRFTLRSGLARYLLAVALGLALPVAAMAHDPKDRNLRVMTYNIRLDLASDGANGWPHRREMVAAVIRHEAIDLLGLQEVLVGQKRDLEAALPEYQMVGAGRDDGREKGEFSPIAFRRDRFDMIHSGTIWLSETPGVPSRGWDAAFPRVATWALLRHRRSGKVMRVINTHFDHVGNIARHQSAALLAGWLAKGAWTGMPTVVMGDFNSPPDGAGYRLLAEARDLSLYDARRASRTPPYGPAGTFNAFRIDSAAAAPIDHIFVSNWLSVETYSVVTQHWGGRLPSDHYPVVASLRLDDR